MSPLVTTCARRHHHVPQITADCGNKESASLRRFRLGSVSSTVPESPLGGGQPHPYSQRPSRVARTAEVPIAPLLPCRVADRSHSPGTCLRGSAKRSRLVSNLFGEGVPSAHGARWNAALYGSPICSARSPPFSRGHASPLASTQDPSTAAMPPLPFPYLPPASYTVSVCLPAAVRRPPAELHAAAVLRARTLPRPRQHLQRLQRLGARGAQPARLLATHPSSPSLPRALRGKGAGGRYGSYTHTTSNDVTTSVDGTRPPSPVTPRVQSCGAPSRPASLPQARYLCHSLPDAVNASHEHHSHSFNSSNRSNSSLANASECALG